MRVVPVLILLLLLGLLAWVTSIAVRRGRLLAEHPERRPYGKGLLFRLSPFIAAGAASLVFGIVARQPLYAVLGVVTLGGFGYELARRWAPPEHSDTQRNR